MNPSPEEVKTKEELIREIDLEIKKKKMRLSRINQQLKDPVGYAKKKAEAKKKWNKENPEKAVAHATKWNKNNKEKRNTSSRKNHQKVKDKKNTKLRDKRAKEKK